MKKPHSISSHCQGCRCNIGMPNPVNKSIWTVAILARVAKGPSLQDRLPALYFIVSLTAFRDGPNIPVSLRLGIMNAVQPESTLALPSSSDVMGLKTRTQLVETRPSIYSILLAIYDALHMYVCSTRVLDLRQVMHATLTITGQQTVRPAYACCKPRCFLANHAGRVYLLVGERSSFAQRV